MRTFAVCAPVFGMMMMMMQISSQRSLAARCAFHPLTAVRRSREIDCSRAAAEAVVSAWLCCSCRRIGCCRFSEVIDLRWRLPYGGWTVAAGLQQWRRRFRTGSYRERLRCVWVHRCDGSHLSQEASSDLKA